MRVCACALTPAVIRAARDTSGLIMAALLRNLPSRQSQPRLEKKPKDLTLGGHRLDEIRIKARICPIKPVWVELLLRKIDLKIIVIRSR